MFVITFVFFIALFIIVFVVMTKETNNDILQSSDKIADEKFIVPNKNDINKNVINKNTMLY